MPKTPRFTVKAGRAIYQDGKHMFTIIKADSVEPVEADQLCHIIVALLNRLGCRGIKTTYLGGETLELQSGPTVVRVRP